MISKFLLLDREASGESLLGVWSVSFSYFVLFEFRVPAVDKYLVKTGAALKFLVFCCYVMDRGAMHEFGC